MFRQASITACPKCEYPVGDGAGRVVYRVDRYGEGGQPGVWMGAWERGELGEVLRKREREGREKRKEEEQAEGNRVWGRGGRRKCRRVGR